MFVAVIVCQREFKIDILWCVQQVASTKVCGFAIYSSSKSSLCMYNGNWWGISNPSLTDKSQFACGRSKLVRHDGGIYG